jgi:hypothetical protein
MMTGESPNNRTQTFQVSLPIEIARINPAKECMSDIVLSYGIFGTEVKQGNREKGELDTESLL